MRFRYLFPLVLFGAIAALSLMAFHSSRPVPRHGVVMEVLDPSLARFAPLWQKEIARRFPYAVGVLCHGGNFVGDQWIVSATSYGRNLTAQDIANYEKARYPGRVIVMLCCNPGHLDLGISGVYFATDSVWCVPDRALAENLEAGDRLLDSGLEPPLNRWDENPGVVGNVYEMISD